MFRFHLGGRLWHHRDFVRMWAGQTVSQVGNQVTLLALPTIAILLLGATTFQVGLLEAVGTVAFPILGPFAGVWVDRFRRRPVMIVSNLGRMISLLTIPVASALGVLSMLQLFAVATVNGGFWVFFDTAYQSYLPSLIDRADLNEGNSKLQASVSGAQVVGPTLAGFLISLVGSVASLITDSLGYLVSAISLLSIRKKEGDEDGRRPNDVPRPFFSQMKDGFKFVFRNPILATLSASVATANFGFEIFTAVYLLFAYRSLGLSPLLVGVIGTVGAIGFLIGVMATGRLSGRLGVGRTLALSITGIVSFSGVALGTLLPAVPTLMAFLFVGYLVLSWFNIVAVTLRQSITPDRFLGRVTATSRALSWGVLPVGSILGGILGTWIGLQPTIVLGGAIAGFASLWIVLGPVVGLRDYPRPLELP